MSVAAAPAHAPEAPPQPVARRGSGETTQLLLVALCAAVAFHLSLATLVRGVAANDPLAVVALIPPGALALALALARPRPGEPAIHDEQLNWLVGLPLLATALALALRWPNWGSPVFWASRADLAVLPVFVAGAIALLGGTRVLWRVRSAVALLGLAWVGPLHDVLLGTAAALTRRFVALVAAGLPSYSGRATTDGALLVVDLGAGRLELAAGTYVLTALVGFALFGVAVVPRMLGSRTRKLAWLGAGLVVAAELAIAGTLLLTGIAAAPGAAYAQPIAPFVGLASALVTAALMIAGLASFGLTAPRLNWSTPARPGRPRALAVVGFAAVVLAAANADLARVAALSTPLGATRVVAFDAAAAAPAGWRLDDSTPPQDRDPYGRIEEYLGTGATWQRLRYRDDSAAVPVTADILTATRPGALDVLGSDRVYTLLGGSPRSRQQVPLGPITATAQVVDDPRQRSTWADVSWTWRVRAATGELDERVTLTTRLPLDSSPAAVEVEQDRLIGLGEQLVAAQLANSGLAADDAGSQRGDS